MSASSGAMGPTGQPLTAAILPPNIFDPRLNGCDWYQYVTDAANSPVPAGAGSELAAGGNSQTSITIDAGTDFYLAELTYQAQVHAAGGLEESTNPVPLVTVQINDAGSTRNLSSLALPIGMIAGDGKRPFRLIRPRLFRALSVVTFTFVSLEPSVGYDHLYLKLGGYRKFSGS